MKDFLRLIVVVLAAIAANAQRQGQSAPALSEAQRKELVGYLVAHYQTPEDYVVSKFKVHDVVFLGEMNHGSKQNLLFLQKLIPKLYKAGVRNLGYEMLESDDQPEVDKIINADTYDDTKALTLLFHWDPQIGWAFQEYADVLRAAWTLNHSLPKGAPRFRIVGTDLRPDWMLVKPGDNITSRPTRWKAWHGSNQIARNVWMYSVIRREFSDKGLKALMYNGAGHTPLSVTRDEREETGLRFSVAHMLYRHLGDRVTSLVIQNAAGQNPVVADLMAAIPVKYQVIGFDFRGTPLGALPLPDRIASTIVTDKKNLTFADYMGGTVFLSFNPEPVTMAPGFITEALVERAKREGWLPDVPEITADSILKHSEMVKGSLDTPPGPRPSR